MEQVFLETVKTAGPIVALIGFFIWRDYVRERNLSNKIQNLEDYVKGKLLNALTETTTAIAYNTKVMEDAARLIQQFTREMEK